MRQAAAAQTQMPHAVDERDTRHDSPRRKPMANGPQAPLVLLVDDDEDSRFLYAHHLTEAAGFRVAEAADGREGVERAVTLRPDVIVLDLSLPDIDGWEALRVLKSDERTRAIPVLALTGATLPPSKPREAGFSAVLRKPCLPDDLAAACAREVDVGRRAES
jgi:CheY-like chemotaxis protein